MHSHVLAFLEGSFAHLGQGTAYITLKDYNDDEQDGTQESAQQPVQGQQVQVAGNKVDNDNDNNAHQHLDSPGTSDQENDPVNNIRDNQDINNILPSEKAERAEKVGHEGLFAGEFLLLM